MKDSIAAERNAGELNDEENPDDLKALMTGVLAPITSTMSAVAEGFNTLAAAMAAPQAPVPQPAGCVDDAANADRIASLMESANKLQANGEKTNNLLGQIMAALKLSRARRS